MITAVPILPPNIVAVVPFWDNTATILGFDDVTVTFLLVASWGHISNMRGYEVPTGISRLVDPIWLP